MLLSGRYKEACRISRAVIHIPRNEFDLRYAAQGTYADLHGGNWRAGRYRDAWLSGEACEAAARRRRVEGPVSEETQNHRLLPTCIRKRMPEECGCTATVAGASMYSDEGSDQEVDQSEPMLFCPSAYPESATRTVHMPSPRSSCAGKLVFFFAV